MIVLWTLAMLLWMSQPLFASESGISGFWVAGSDAAASSDADTANLPVDAVSWWLNENGSYMVFLPSTANLSSLKVWFDADQPVFVGTTELTSNSLTNAFTGGGSFTLTCGSSAYRLTVMQSAHIPAMFLSTSSGTMVDIDNSHDHSVGENGDMLLVEDDGNVVYDDDLSQIKGRGNYTWALPKKPYQIKLDNKTDLLGMGNAKTWVLLANYTDPSFLRNRLVFAFADQLGLAYTSHGAYVDLYANHQYLGNYLLCEKVQVGSNRVEITDLEAETQDINVNDLDTYTRGGTVQNAQNGTSKWYNIPNNPADITGGYLLEFDFTSRYLDEACGFVTDRGIPVVIKSPEYASKEQVAYIRNYVQELEDAIFGENGYNDKGKHYFAYVDADSLVYHYLVEEWSHNTDGGFSSFYLYKDSAAHGDGKLYCGPVWDYDLAFGSFGRYRIFEESAKDMCTKNQVDWYVELFNDKTFVDKVNKAYEGAAIPAAEALLANDYDRWAGEIAASAAMDQARWAYADQGIVDFSASVSALKSYIEVRTEYLDGNFFTNGLYFKDVKEGSWYYKNVMYAADNGYMNGTGDYLFAPDQTLTRGMVVTVLARVSGEDLSAYPSSAFTDVAPGKWYAPAVAWANAKKIVAGYRDGTFRPDQNITREEMAQIIKNYAAYQGADTTADNTVLAGYDDAGLVSGWAKDALCWCKSQGLIGGVSATRLAPQSASTRAQFCTVIKRYLTD